MSPRAYVLSFSAAASGEQVKNALQIATDLGAISPGTNDHRYLIVISSLFEFERFQHYTSEWQNNGTVLVRPLGP
jgi:hypothetical protein